VTPELVLYHTPEFHRLPKFAVLQVHGFESSASGLYDFATSKLHRSKVPSHRAFATPRLREFGTPDRRAFATPRLREFQTPDPRDFLVPENIFTNFMNLDVSRVTGFPEFSNTSPSGKRVDSDDPIPRTFQNFSQKTSPSERRRGHVSPGNLATVESRHVRRTTAPRPYK
jgi:hypothetical protein